MATTFPIHPKYFITLDNIHQHGDAVIDGDLAGYLMQQGYVTLHGTEYATTSKGREFMRKFGNIPEFLSVVRADWPHQLLAALRKCEHNTDPKLSNEALQSLVNTGYLIHAETGSYLLTDKARDVLRKYRE